MISISIIATFKTLKVHPRKFLWLTISFILPNAAIIAFAVLYRNTSGGTWTELEGPIYGFILIIIYSICNYFIQINEIRKFEK